MSAPLRHVEIALLERAIDALLAEHPDLAEDATLRADMLDGETDLHAVLGRILERRQEARTMKAAIAGRRKAMGERQARYEAQEDAMNRLALRVMDMANLSKVTLPEATLSVSAGKASVDIAPDAQVPDAFCRIKREPDKTLIKTALESGTPINWATLSKGAPSLTVRTR